METDEILSTGSVTNLAELIKACAFPKKAFFLAEQLPSHIIKHEQRQAKESHEKHEYIQATIQLDSKRTGRLLLCNR